MQRAKRRSAEQTKAKILAAARAAFSRHGYPNVGIRDVADLAGVNNALLARYFGSKAGLFEAALIDAIDTRLVGLDRGSDSAELVMSNLLTLHQDAGGMVLLSAGDPEVRSIVIRVANEHVIPGLAAMIGGPRAAERALQIIILACGFIFATRLLPVGPGDSVLMQQWLRTALKEVIERPETDNPQSRLSELGHFAEENIRLRRLLVKLMLENDELQGQSCPPE